MAGPGGARLLERWQGNFAYNKRGCKVWLSSSARVTRPLNLNPGTNPNVGRSRGSLSGTDWIHWAKWWGFHDRVLSR
jgi:hypothetical protein